MDIVCFSHLRWSFVYQRPQHILSRFARRQKVFFMEEPIYDAPMGRERLALDETADGVTVAVPHLPEGTEPVKRKQLLRRLLTGLLESHVSQNFIFWYYTPMALEFSGRVQPDLCVYDCMDELSAFLGAPAEMRLYEQMLMARADVVFTGGRSLYEAKKGMHPNLHAMPSSIDHAHFSRAASGIADPADQEAIAHPRMGYYGVIDERMDMDLVAWTANNRPDWNFIFIGPVVKIAPASLPRGPNIYFLGQKTYAELPAYLGNWDVAALPFALNESTRFISPTKVPEYLAGLKPVVSTAIRDVVNDYGRDGLVYIAESREEFASALDQALLQSRSQLWKRRVLRKLAAQSWDATWNNMDAIIEQTACRLGQSLGEIGQG